MEEQLVTPGKAYEFPEKKCPIPWHQIHLLSNSLAEEFKEDKITHVIGLARGGLVPATIISYVLEVPLLSYAVSTYSLDNTFKTQGKFTVRQSVNLKELKEKNAHVLVVDDICDSGDTIMYVSDKIAESGIKAKYTTLFTRQKTKKLLDRYGVLVSDDMWVVFPWE